MQIDSLQKRSFGGTGLGLAISKQLTDLMEGSIGIHSDDGEGAEFYFTATFDKSELSSSQDKGADLSLNQKRFYSKT